MSYCFTRVCLLSEFSSGTLQTQWGWEERQAGTSDPTVPTGRGLTVTKAESSGAREPNATPMGSGHLPPWRSRRFTQRLNSDFHERPPGGARGAPLAASEAFGVGERGAAGTRRGPPDTAEAPPFFRLLPGRVSMEPPDGLPRPLWSSGTGFPRTKVRTPRPQPHRGQAQTPAAGNQSKRLSGA